MNSVALLCLSLVAAQPDKKDAPKVDAKPHALASLKLRAAGPALMSGRVVGFAVHPTDRAHYYVAVASGGVWKTTNGGTTWTPIFDNEGSYSIGCVTLDPKNPNVVWVGTGENNSQRSVGYGDGVYKSIDGGRTWQNVGLKNSEHIGKIAIDPRNSDTVYVAAQGPLWGPGGDRGLYKTTDGGKTWTKLLDISENTGVSDFVQDPRNPDTILAVAYQRRRHVWTIVNGGPECALHRTTDGGKTWTKVRAGLPGAELGRIGLAFAPSDPDTVYAVVEAAEKQGGLFRSVDRGVTWEKRNSYDEQGQYYSHVVVDPTNKDRVFMMNMIIQVSDDGGKTLGRMSERWKHVDNHELWIDPKNPNYYLVGCDGGIYESFDRGANWKFAANLPVTQFYDINCEQIDSPFYRIYGGTQDNNTIGGPNRTMSSHGITNADWHVLVGGDGFQIQIDPKDPNIVYAEFQYGGLMRFDWRTGQRVPIQPQPGLGEPPLRWNWDSPLLVSPHKNTRVYFAANRLFRSDDRGDSWTAVSPDLSRQLDRDKLPVFGKILGPEAVFKHGSTSLYGNITALAESLKTEGLIYVGTDDGLIQVTEDGGKAWRKIEKFPGVPDRTYVARLYASRHEANTVYAAFDNHKSADFAPYLLKSTDAGRSWTAIIGELPARGSVLAFVEDHVDPKLLFCGTEFGLFFTADGGAKWHRLKNGLPTIAVRDLAIQRPMNDLVVGTFGRGFYILDDYSPLRASTPEALGAPAAIFPVRDAALYMSTQQYGGRGKASLGESFYTADNPPFGATIAYHLKDSLPTRKAKRKEAAKKGNDAYPSLADLRAEVEEEAPAVLMTIADAEGTPLRVINVPGGAGVQRATWDLRLTGASLSRPAVAVDADEDSPVFGGGGGGPLALPGKYKVGLAKRVDGVVTPLAGPVEFNVKYVGTEPLPADDLKTLAEFQKQVIKLQRDLNVATGTSGELSTRLEQVKQALDQTPTAPADAKEKVRKLIVKHREMNRALTGDSFLASRYENAPPSIAERVGNAAAATRTILAKPTGTQREQHKFAAEELGKVSGELKQTDKELKELEQLLDKLGAPWTPGRR